MMEKIKRLAFRIIWNKAALFIALFHFLSSFWTDRLMFHYVTWDFSDALQTIKSVETAAVKIVFLAFVVLLWQGIFYFFSKADKGFRYRSLFYFGVMFVLLLLTWPGIWRMDEFGLLSSSVQLFPHWWQNYITSVWYIFSLMLFPFPSGVILVQMIVAALIYARFVSNCLREYDLHMGSGGLHDESSAPADFDTGNGAKKRRFSFAVIVSIPFFFFPVLDSNLYPLRMSLYAFLELLLLSELYLLYRKRRLAETDLQTGGVYQDGRCAYALSFLAAVVTVWRTEAVYYLILFPVILLLIGGVRRYRKQIVLYIVMLVILFVPQKAGEKMTSGDQYELTSVVLPLVPLVLEAQRNGEDALLEQINLVVDTDVISRAAAEGKNGISMFWSEPDFQRVYTTEDFACFKSAYYKLIIKYPVVFLTERRQTFLSSTDLLENTTELFADVDVENYKQFRTYPLSGPISEKTRTAVINMLEIRHLSDYTEKYQAADLIYSPLPAVLILAAVFIVLLAQKKWTLAVILSASILRAPLVFLTAPSRLFMYYYSVYLVGYVLLFYVMAGYIFRRGQKRYDACHMDSDKELFENNL